MTAAQLPAWSRPEPGRREGYALAFRASRLSMGRLTLVILGLVVVLGGLLANLLVWLSQWFEFTAYSWPAIVVLGLAIGVPTVVVMRRLLRGRECRVVFDARGVSVVIGRDRRAIAWPDIAWMTYRTDSDYARLVIAPRDGRKLTLNAGLRTLAFGDSERTVLPDLPQPVRRLLVAQGFEERPPDSSRAPGLWRYRR